MNESIGEDSSPWLLTKKQVADKLQVCPRQVSRLRNKGELPDPVRLGTSVRWPAKELDSWIMAGCPNRDRWQIIRSTSNQ